MALVEAIVTEAVKVCTAELAGGAITGAKQFVGWLRDRRGPLPKDPERIPETLSEWAQDPEWFAEFAAMVSRLAPTPDATPPEPPPTPFFDCAWFRDNAPLAGVYLIGGQRGSGRTALVRRIGADQAHRFPGGRVEVDLDHYTEGDEVRIGDARAYVLRALGIADDDQRSAPAELADQYRAVTVTRSFVLIVDNVSDPAHLAQLEISPANLTLATTDELTTDLRAAYPAHVTLHGLDAQGAWDFLATRCGRHLLDHDPVATRQLFELCGTRPDVLRRVGVNLQRRATERHPVADLVTEYQAAGVSGADSALAKALRDTLAQLPATTARTLAQLATHPGVDFTVDSAAILLDRPARGDIDSLIDHALAIPVGEGRYRLDPLARGHVGEHQDEAAFDRFLLAYRDRAVAADLREGRKRLRRYDRPGEPEWHGDEDPIAWLDGESEVIGDLVARAFRLGRHKEVCQLVGAVEVLVNKRGRWRWYAALTEWAVRSAVALHQAQRRPALAARVHQMRARAHTLTRNFPRAKADLDEALRLAADVPTDHQLAASIHEFRGRLGEEQADSGVPMDFPPDIEYRQAVEIDEQTGDGRGCSIHARMLARWLVKTGRYREALSLLDLAEERHTDARNLALVRLTRTRALLGLRDTAGARQQLSLAEAGLAATGSGQYYWELQEITALVEEAEGKRDDANARWLRLFEAAFRVGHPRTNEYLSHLPSR